jgi:hypothetical protein
MVKQSLDILAAKEQAYKKLEGQWVEIAFGTGEFFIDYGRIQSVKQGIIQLNPYIRDISTSLKSNVELYDGEDSLPIPVDDVGRCMPVPETYIDDVLESMRVQSEIEVKNTRKELGLDGRQPTFGKQKEH